jgi:hypothetical protein
LSGPMPAPAPAEQAPATEAISWEPVRCMATQPASGPVPSNPRIASSRIAPRRACVGRRRRSVAAKRRGPGSRIRAGGMASRTSSQRELICICTNAVVALLTRPLSVAVVPSLPNCSRYRSGS